MGESSEVVDWGDIDIHIKADDKHFARCVFEGIHSDVAYVVDVVEHTADLVVDSVGEYC